MQNEAEPAGISRHSGGSATPELLPSATRLGCSRCRHSPGGCLSCDPDWDSAVQAAKRKAKSQAKLVKEIGRLRSQLEGAAPGGEDEYSGQVMAHQSTLEADGKSLSILRPREDNRGQAAVAMEHSGSAEAAATAAAEHPPPPLPGSSEVDSMDATVDAEAEVPWPLSPPLPPDENASAAELQAPLPPTEEHVSAPPDSASLQLSASVSLSAEDFAALQDASALLGSANLGLSREGTAAIQHVVAQGDGAQEGASVLLSLVDHANIKQLVAHLTSGQQFAVGAASSSVQQTGSQPHARPQRMFSIAAGQGQSPAEHVQPATTATDTAQQPSSPRLAGVFSATTPYSLPRPVSLPRPDSRPRRDGPRLQTQSMPITDRDRNRPLRGLHPDYRPWGAALPDEAITLPPAGEVNVPGLDFDPATDVPKVEEPPSRVTRIGGPITLRVPGTSAVVRGTGNTARRGGGRTAPQRAPFVVPTVSVPAPDEHATGTLTAPAGELALAQGIPPADQQKPGPMPSSPAAGAASLTVAKSLDAPLPGLGPVPHEGLEAVKKLLLPLKLLKLFTTVDTELFKASKSEHSLLHMLLPCADDILPGTPS